MPHSGDQRGLPRVVLATDSTIPSGVGEHMLTLARALHPIWTAVVAFPSKGEAIRFLQRARSAELEVKVIDGSGDGFAAWLKQSAAVVLHVHAGISWEGHGLVEAGRVAGVPVVRTEHLPYMLTNENQQTAHRLGISGVDRIVTVSEAAAETYRLAGICSRRLITIRNGIETPTPAQRPSEIKSSLRIAIDEQVVLTVARFTPQKGYEILLRAAQQVTRTVPNSRFLFVGTGPDQAVMEELAAALGISASVMFLGVREDVPDLLTVSDLFVLPSFFEGLPLSLLEAMAIGMAVIATRIGGTVEALGGDYPWLIEPGDSAGLAALITSALEDKPQLEAMGRRNKRRFESAFRAERMARETAALYEAVLAEKSELA